MKNCPKCGMKLDGDWRFCPKDGTDLQGPLQQTVPMTFGKVCPRCGRTYDSRARFCEKDGAVLEPATRAGPGR